MSDNIDQDKNRQEEEMASGPVSAGASNKSISSQQNVQPSGDTSKQSNQDYAPLLNDNPNSAPTGKNTAADRDLGTVGGGNIPGNSGSDATRGGVSSSNSTVERGDGSSGSTIGAGAPTDRGSIKDAHTMTTSGTTNTIDKQAQGNVGGRNPSQPQTAMGDQDATQGRSGDDITDPMTSRAPDKIDK